MNKPNDCQSRPCVTCLRGTADSNTALRTIVWTGKYLQCTVMCIAVGGEIGEETHDKADQLLYVEEGCCKCIYECPTTKCPVEKCAEVGDAFFVPACTPHNVINTGNRPLKLVSVYAPPIH